jgi:hypothetical protein
LWSGVRLVINQYNHAIQKSINLLEGASNELQQETLKIQSILESTTSKDNPVVTKIGEKALDILQNLKLKIDEYTEEYSTKIIKEKFLPTSWALIFFAALSVLLAHLIYQTSAPEIVRQSTFVQYRVNQKDEYVKNMSNAAISRALNYIAEAEPTIWNFCCFKWKFDRFRRLRLELSMPLGEQAAEELKEQLSQLRSSRDKEIESHRKEIDIIEAGAAVRYLLEARGKPLAFLTSGILYLIGIILILWIIVRQSLAVVEAAGGWRVLIAGIVQLT